MFKVLFVCTGNTCRSSMAEALAKKLLQDKGEETARVEVASAGTATVAGLCASPHAVTVMGEHGIDLTAHRTTPLTPELIDGADLILTMTQAHKHQVCRLVPAASEKTFTLKEFAGQTEDLDVADPFGQGEDVYRACAREIQGAISAAWEKIASLAEEKKDRAQEDGREN